MSDILSVLRVVTVAAAVPVLSCLPAHAQDDTPRKSLPHGFKAIAVPGTDGVVLIGEAKNVRGGAELVNRSLGSLARYFDARPQVLGAISDNEGREVQFLFAAVRGGKLVNGFGVAHADGGSGTVGLAFDSPKALPANRDRLSRLMKEHLPGPARVSWQNRQLPDGSGALKVPEGWEITAINSMVSAKGPQGAVDLGIWAQVYTPEGAQNPFGLKAPLVAAYGEPFQALRDVSRQFLAASGQQLRSLRRIEETPAPWAQGRGAYIRWEAEIATGGNIEKYQGVTLVLMSPVGGGQWLYYASTVASKSEDFGKNLPVLMEVWKSWKVSDHVYRQRLDKAMQSMKETYRLYQSANDYRQKVMSRALDDFSEYVRGTSIVYDFRRDEYSVNSTYGLDRLIERLNEREGHVRYRIVPLKDLNNPW
jgi:hypothetical protein